MSQDIKSIKNSSGPGGTPGSGSVQVSSSSKRDKYVRKMKQQLDQLNAKLDEVEADARAFSAESRKKYEEQMTNLRQMAKSANKKLEDIKDTSEDQWERLVAEGEKIQKAFIHSFNYFKSQLK